MKKILLIISFVFVLLIGCSNSEKIELKIIVPSGAPAISQSYIQENKADLGKNVSYDVKIVQGKDSLISAFTNKDFDIIFAPIDLGAQLYNKNSLDYKLTATVTFGNVYLLAQTEQEFNLEYLNNKDLVFFGKNSSPDIITSYVLENITPKSITYLNSSADTQNHFIANEDAICLVAEPAVSVIKSKLPNTKTLDIQELYKNKMNDSYYPQASVFISNNLIENHKKIVDDYLENLLMSVEKISTNVEEIADICVKLNYGFTKQVLLDSIQRSNIHFKESENIKTDIDKYFNLILSKNSAILSGKIPDENFYYKK